MKYPKRSQYKHAKSQYRVRNWPEYEAGLQKRGALTVWLSEAALGAWRAPATGRPRGQRAYSDLTSRRTADCARVPGLLDQIEDRVASVMADGAYDAGMIYEAAQGKGDGQRVRVLIPPGRGARPSSVRSPGQRERNRNVRSMRRLGHREWYGSSGYSRLSLVGNAVFRYKTIFGQRMRSRSFENQRVEVDLACKILGHDD
jgi:hypothetical protein